MDTDRQSAEAALKGVVTYPILLDATPVGTAYGVAGLPALYLIGPDGTVLTRYLTHDYTGYKEFKADIVRRLIPLLGGIRIVAPAR